MSVYTTTHTPTVLASHGARTAQRNTSYIISYITNLLLTTPSPKILDIGCGPGSITVSLAKLFPTSHITGIEITEIPLVEARKLAASEGVTNVEFKVGDCHDLKALGMEDERFDVVCCHQVLQHVRDPVAVMREMRRVCRKGNGGFVAVKELADMPCFPESEAISLSNRVYQEVARAKGGNPRPGRRLHVWAKEAGFDSAKLISSTSNITHRTRQERELVGKGIRERIKVGGELGTFAVQNGICSVEELEEMGRAWGEWIEDDERGWLTFLNGELVAFV
jgi:ubiquinone/menaquinone biosynthesis C-methylase UbiE